jgi:ribosome maturation factor RimP
VSHPLRTQRDFDRVQGRVVTVRRTAADGPHEVTGTVRDADAAHVVIATDDTEVSVAYDDIETATQALPW